MFGVIVSGRLVQTDFQRVSPTQFLCNIPDADSINHVVIFLTGSEPFPEDTGGLVYFSWPDPVAVPSWQLLGHISNVKPSAIFKIANLKKDTISPHPFMQQQVSHLAQIGISVEPLISIANQTPVTVAAPSTVDSFTEFTSKMLENFFNYASSFALTQATMVPNSTETYVPLGTLQNWYVNFQRRLQTNPYFWKN